MITYTPELAEEICERIANGESLRAICRDKHMPTESAVRKWASEDRCGFSAQYVRARDLQADHYADEIIDISDDTSCDWMQTKDGPILNHEHVQRSKLRIDARKWVAAKLLPKKYGDKLQVGGTIGTRELTHEEWLATCE